MGQFREWLQDMIVEQSQNFPGYNGTVVYVPPEGAVKTSKGTLCITEIRYRGASNLKWVCSVAETARNSSAAAQSLHCPWLPVIQKASLQIPFLWLPFPPQIRNRLSNLVIMDMTCCLICGLCRHWLESPERSKLIQEGIAAGFWFPKTRTCDVQNGFVSTVDAMWQDAFADDGGDELGDGRKPEIAKWRLVMMTIISVYTGNLLLSWPINSAGDYFRSTLGYPLGSCLIQFINVLQVAPGARATPLRMPLENPRCGPRLNQH